MAIRKRVNLVLADWCGVAPDDQTISLEILWTSTRNNPDRPHVGIDFQPDGVNDLRDKLIDEFKKPGNERKRVSVIKAVHFKPTGDIDTVNDLVSAITTSPNLKSTPEEES